MSSLIEEPVTVTKLFEDHYTIPDYQRGYRWRPEEVNELIEDIEASDDKQEDGYFLNVLIRQKNSDDKSYDIVDGQQRLTTIAILKRLCNEDNETVKELLGETEKISRNPSDLCFIKHAKDGANVKDKDQFRKKLNKCRFFVYEIDGTKEDAAKVFERINTGKIPLSSAELLKADWVSEEKGRIGQKNRASRWQRIEALLQNDDFFFFICPKHASRRYQATRMDYILELFFANCREDECYKEFAELYEKDSIFLYKKMREELSFDKLEKYVLDFLYSYCYLNADVHNYTGYRLYNKKEAEVEFSVFKDIYSKKFENKQFSFFEELKGAAVGVLNNKRIENLKKGVDDKIIYPLLFLSMILRYSDEHLPFDFVRYASTEWDIEHIHARNQGEPTSKDVKALLEAIIRAGYIKSDDEYAKFINDKLELVKEKDGVVSDKFDRDVDTFYNGLSGLQYLVCLINSIVIRSKEGSGQMEKDDSGYYIITPQRDEETWLDSIGNLVLLPATINRGFGNAIYPLKCDVIKDACETQREYIPFCVEEKYNSLENEWNKEAMTKYLTELKKLFGLEGEYHGNKS